MRTLRLVLSLSACVVLSGCGLFVPGTHEIYEAGTDDKNFENIIINNIQCELAGGANRALAFFDTPGPHSYKSVEWLRGLGATVDLKFTVQETGTLNPGVALNPPPPFSLGLGLQSSASATRQEEIGFTYAFEDLLAKHRRDLPCVHENGILIQSDLNIKDFIFDKLFLATVPGSVPAPYHVFSYHLTFVASYSANATPTWTFKHLTVNPSSRLFDLSRSKTSDLTITIGPVEKAATDTSPAQLSAQAQAVHAASLVGQAVSAAIQQR